MARQNEIAITTRDGAVSGSFRRGRQGCHLAHDRAWRLLQRVDHTYGLRYAPGDLFLRPYRAGVQRRAGGGNPGRITTLLGEKHGIGTCGRGRGHR